MPADYDKFAGFLPYASELFGIYQPLLGWKSRRTRLQFQTDHHRLLASAVKQMSKNAPRRKLLLRNPRPIGPDDLVEDDVPQWMATETGRAFRTAAQDFVKANKRSPNDNEWQAIADTANFPKVLKSVSQRDGGRRNEQRISIAQEAVVAGTLLDMVKNTPHVLADAVKASLHHVAAFLGARDPLANFDPQSQQAVLSPIGLIDLYRQYFFEFETFLGPPVGHVWVSPGGSLEVFEIQTRKTVREQRVESSTEKVSRSEAEVQVEDELSTAIAEQNSRDISLGVSASGGVDLGVFEASASASMGIDFNHQTSQESAHRRTRNQSETVSNEIRKNFKTAFRTSVETTDTSSRRYTLQNTTDKLVNYELRRKMRQVGVQVQHLGTQLCWQTFVDEPGMPLGVSTLVHVAAPKDALSVEMPEAPPELAPRKDQHVFTFDFEPLDEEAEDDGEDETYVKGFDIEEDPGEGEIRWKKKISVAPPAEGFTLESASVASSDRVDPEEDPPEVAAECEVTSDKEFEIRLNRVNFNDQPGIRFTVDLIWSPPTVSAEVQAEYEQKKKEYSEEKARLARQQYVKAVRDRIKIASDIRPRSETDLREEERTVIFRRLVQQLTGIKNGPEPHLMTELIRAIFDVDKMLYFVAPEWWMPHARYKQELGPSGTLTNEDLVSWGGAKAWGRSNYFITEESEPAPLGASLGWLIQLDGDAHRNAFLNSPWVKAVIPIRPDREIAGINWLQLAHVEGSEGLDAKYGGSEAELQGKTIKQALSMLAKKVQGLGTDINNVLATEKVFETGFDPLEDGFRATGVPFQVFDQWTEVLPTDQVVAIEYDTSSGEVQ